MGLNKRQINKVEDVLRSSLRRKFENYNPEPASMPFHTRLLLRSCVKQALVD